MPKYRYTLSAGYYKDPVSGKRKQHRKQITVVAKKKSVADKIKEAEEEKFRSSFMSSKPIVKFKDLVAEYYRVNNDLKPKTVAGDRTYMNALITYFGDMDLIDITGPVIEAYLINLSKIKKGVNHLHAYRKNLKKYMTFAYARDYISVNPFDKVLTPIGKATKAKDNKDELIDFCENLLRYMVVALFPNEKNIADVRFILQFLLAGDACLRNTELYGLKWSDISYERKTIQITRDFYSISKKEAKRQGVASKGLLSTKTDGSERTVPLSEITLLFLRRYQNLQEEYLKKRNAINPENLLFTNRIGVLEDQKIQREVSFPYGEGFAERLESVCKKIGLEKITPYDIRRIGNSVRLIEEVPKEVCEYVMGHNPSKVDQAYRVNMLRRATKEHAKWENYISNLINSSKK